MKHNEEKITGETSAWEERKLGASADHVAIADIDEAQINEKLGLQMISIRLPQSLIEDFKAIAKLHGLGYQPLMRQILARFAESEKKRLLNQAVAELENSRETNKAGPDKIKQPRQKHA